VIRRLLALAVGLLLAGCAAGASGGGGHPGGLRRHTPSSYQGDASQSDYAEGEAPSTEAAFAVRAADRSEADRALDAGRKPEEMLEFFGIASGMRIGELGAGTGYTTELLARITAPQGVVYAQNSPALLEAFAEAPWAERLGKPAMRNVVRLDRDFDDPFPPDVAGLDAVLIVLFYHDTAWLGVDRDAMNRAVLRALKPGGVYGIVDHSAWPGSGTAEAHTLHRIDERLLREEVERAGFELVDQAFFLRNPDDGRDWSPAPAEAGELRGSSDRFVLKFVKPDASNDAAFGEGAANDVMPTATAPVDAGEPSP
jgi:predicted methyltransferase